MPLIIGGVYGLNQSTSCDPMGVLGMVVSDDRGIGVRGQANSPTGTGIGVLGEATSPNGAAGVFNMGDVNGSILLGLSLGSNAFRVDGTGKVFANGGFQTGGADFAESMAVSGNRNHYEPGDLMVIDRGANRVQQLAKRR